MGCTTSFSVQDEGGKRFSRVRGKRNTILDPGLYDHTSPLSFDELTRMRNEFWDTNENGTYGGFPEIWAMLKAICEALIDGNIDEANRLARDSDLLVHGSSISVCYDSKGNEYTVPAYCYCRPKKLVQASTPNDIETEAQNDEDVEVSNTNLEWVRVRIAPAAEDIHLQIDRRGSILSLKRKILTFLSTSSTALGADDRRCIMMDAPPARQRIFLRGCELDNKENLDTLPNEYWSDVDPAKTDRRKRSYPIQMFLIPPKPNKTRNK